MRATSFAGVALAIFALSACGRSATETQRLPVDRVDSPARIAVNPALPSKTPGRARLTALRGSQAADQSERPPLATFSQYDGRGPNAASVPRGVQERPLQLSSLLERSSSDPTSQSDGGPVPKRDIVDLGLDAKARNSDTRAKTPEKVLAVAKAPAPIPRPVRQSPEPAVRPVVASIQSTDAVAPQAPQPSIAVLKSPSLPSPYGTQDRTPTGLPQFGDAPSIASGLPLSVVPASLGAANIQSAEAAVPAADGLEQSSADASGGIGWDEAAALIRAGEVKTLEDIGEFEVLLTLCSGRGVISIQPTPNAISEVEMPKVICGKSASLTPQ